MMSARYGRTVGARRRRTTTSNFGVGARESHDATRFYERFRAPELSTDDTVPARRRSPSRSSAATPATWTRSPTARSRSSSRRRRTSPASSTRRSSSARACRRRTSSTSTCSRDVFAECARKLEPGGRIAVNVANLGRKPYRSLSADVIRILEHDLGLLLRGELIWQKGEGASGSCAWGSFRSAANPVLRDITERVIVASKGRFDRARSAKQRAAEGLPHESTLLTDDFMALTLDVWSIPPESARRVGHPAPFPVELPEQLIRLYTYDDDLVLDPFMGSGSALVAAARLGRRYVGYDLDADVRRHRPPPRAARAAAAAPTAAADRRGRQAAERIAERRASTAAGFTIAGERRRIRRHGRRRRPRADRRRRRRPGSSTSPVRSRPTAAGCCGPTSSGGRSAGPPRCAAGAPEVPLLLLTTDLPKPRSEGDAALRAARDAVFDVVDLLDDAARARLATYATKGPDPGPAPGFW